MLTFLRMSSRSASVQLRTTSYVAALFVAAFSFPLPLLAFVACCGWNAAAGRWSGTCTESKYPDGILTRPQGSSGRYG